MPGDLENLGIQWYVPNQDSVQFVNSIAQTFLAPQLEFVSSLSPSTEISKCVASRLLLHEFIYLFLVYLSIRLYAHLCYLYISLRQSPALDYFEPKIKTNIFSHQ